MHSHLAHIFRSARTFLRTKSVAFVCLFSFDFTQTTENHADSLNKHYVRCMWCARIIIYVSKQDTNRREKKKKNKLWINKYQIKHCHSICNLCKHTRTHQLTNISNYYQCWLHCNWELISAAKLQNGKSGQHMKKTRNNEEIGRWKTRNIFARFNRKLLTDEANEAHTCFPIGWPLLLLKCLSHNVLPLCGPCHLIRMRATFKTVNMCVCVLMTFM